MNAIPMKRFGFAGAALVALVAGTAVTLAADEPSGLVRSDQAVAAAPQLAQTPVDSRAGYLSLAEVEARLQADGYTDIREIGHEGATYEVRARNPAGVLSELYLDARTGAVLDSEEDD